MSAPPIPAPESGRGSMLRRGLLNQPVCLVVGLVLWLVSPHNHSFWSAYLYAFVIGNLIWLTVDGGRQLTKHLAGPANRGREWPGWLAMAPLVVLGAIVGYSVGTPIVDALLGRSSPRLFASVGVLATTLIAAAAATYFFYTREQLHAERVRAEQARRLALENQLKLLESQLEPHMLFNTLANLRVLIAIDPERAQAMLDRLIAYLRATLAGARVATHPLHAEFERLADYLALMAVRMGPRLAVHFELPAELRDVAVPPLLLQPLVENAIRHGLEPKVEGGRIDVAAARDGAALRLTVHDSGAGIDAAAATGYGTTHVRERLAALYGTAARLELQPLQGGGTAATVTLPLAPSAPATTSPPCTQRTTARVR
jgi:signal transduction histidine kinase